MSASILTAAAAGASARVFDVQRFSVHDGPGIRTTVFLAGCPLRCAWCQNPEAFSGAGGRVMTARAALAEVLADRDYYAASGGGLTVSGGEPLLHGAFLRELLAGAKAAGLSTCVQTSGAVPLGAALAVKALVDLFQLDLKHMDDARHRELTGAGLDRVHATADALLAHGARVEFRVPLVPGVNDDAENLGRVAAFLAARGVEVVRLVPYQRHYLAKYERLGLWARFADVEPPTPAALQAVAAGFHRRGVGVEVDG